MKPPLLQKEKATSEDVILVHLADELVNVRFPVTEVTTLDEVLELACPPAASGVGKLEWPEEVARLLEVGAGGEDLVDKILNGEDVMLAERLFDNPVVRERNALLVDLAVATFVDKLADGLQVGFARNESVADFFDSDVSGAHP